MGPHAANSLPPGIGNAACRPALDRAFRGSGQLPRARLLGTCAPEQQQPTIVGWEQLIGLIQQLRSNGYSDLRRIELQPPYVAVWARDRSGQWVALTLDESGNLRERQELTGPPRPATQGTEQARLRIRIGPLRLRLENLTIDVQAPLEEILRIVQDDQQGSGQEDSSGSQGRQ